MNGRPPEDPPEELRSARARAGLSLDEAAQRTRIPAKYLDALEKGDLSVFPPGPFLGGYTRQYRRFLGLPETPVATLRAPEATRPTLPTPAPRVSPGGAAELDERTITLTGPNGILAKQSRARLVALGVAATAVVGLGVAVAVRAIPDTPPDVGTLPDQVVSLTTMEPVRATVVADGRTVFTGQIAPGAASTYKAHDRLELSLASLEGVVLHYNGNALKPLGAQSRPRRLVFIDDRNR